MTTQGSRAEGSDCSASLLKFVETPVFLVSTVGVTAVTVICSSILPISMVMLISVFVPTWMMTPVLVNVLKPVSSALRAKSFAGERPGNRKMPWAFEIWLIGARMLADRVIVTPGRAVPSLSVIFPYRLPVLTWADAATAKTSANRTIKVLFKFSSFSEVSFLVSERNPLLPISRVFSF